MYYDSLNRDFSGPINIILEKIDSSMSLYRENSIINAFNSSVHGILIDSLLAEVVRYSLQYTNETDGTFDITVGPLVKAWGFHAKKGEMPERETITNLMKFIGSDMIELENLYLGKKHPEVKIDVNAIAQGFTVDQIAQSFENEGISDYLIEIGGEIRALGKSPRGAHWLVGVDRPEDNALSGDNLQVIIKLSGESLVTSGNYRKFFVRDGVKYSHTIDAQTGYPVNHSLLSATVLDSTATRADALATAFMVMGKERVIEWLSNNPGVEAYLVYSDENGDFQVWISEGMSERIVE
jgi:thiamine biosynthesis lipoprotein